MDVSQPNMNEPSPEELRDLEKLKMIIERAIADGKISKSELDAMKTQAWSDGKITPEELELYSSLVLDKIRTGELKWEF
ncbi:hypothetical protein [Pantanalinema sp. GBBB05]|uniref:hypothetical protein n=1 Tax=Pantanalinema sp. GBBB05 TaxID=2604139 RepID=UPI001DE82E53|nr:hypothetical protein [Pantanalinema sp. GBBB05]